MTKMTIAKRLMLMSGIGVLSLCITVFVGWSGFRTAETSLADQTASAVAVRTQTLIDMMHDALRADAYRSLTVKTQEERDVVVNDTKEHAQNMLAWLDEQIVRADKGIIGPDAAQAVKGSAEDVRKYTQTAVDFVSAPPANEADAAAGIAAFQKEFERLEGVLGGAGEAVEKSGEKASKNAAHGLATSREILLVVALVAIAAVALISWRISTAITQRINSLRSALDRVAAKDLTVQINDHSPDELGSMAESLTTSIETTRTAMNAIRASAMSLTSQSHRLAGLSSQLGSSAEQTTIDVNTVASNSSSVNASVQSVAESTEALSTSINEISQSAMRVAAIASHAVGVAEQTNAIVAKLGDSSEAISEVIDTITSIAGKTNLLALNATIEAARAGAAGRGFAVVANEVKDLAHATGKATDDIRERIVAIREDTIASIAAIGQIANIVVEISDLQNTIAAAVEEQAVTTQEITRTLGTAASSSSDIADSIERVAHSAQGSSDGASDAEAAAMQLTELANELEHLVDEFQVNA